MISGPTRVEPESNTESDKKCDAESDEKCDTESNAWNMTGRKEPEEA